MAIKELVLSTATRLLFTSGQKRQAMGIKCCGYTAMKPLDFLKLTVDTNVSSWIDNERSLEQTHTLDEYNAWTRSGDNIHMPWLDVLFEDKGSKKAGTVIGHEGRHRALAVIDAGGKSMNVAICLRDSSGYPSYRENYQRYRGLQDIPPIWWGQFNHSEKWIFDPSKFVSFYKA